MTKIDIATSLEADCMPAPDLYRLSPRELEVAALIGQGLTSREAAEILAISRKTVESHRAHIITKLGARNSAHLAYMIGTMSRARTSRPDIVYLEDFRDAFGFTAHGAANDTAPGVVFVK